MKKKKKKLVRDTNLISQKGKEFVEETGLSSPFYPKKLVICNHSNLLYFCEYHVSHKCTS